MQMVNGVNVGLVPSPSEEEIKYMAENVDYYADYGNLLIHNISQAPILNQVLKHMTENKIGDNLSLEKILPNFFNIKAKINVTETALLEQLNRWEVNESLINRNNIQTIVPDASFFQYSLTTKNTLTDYLNKTIVEALSNVPADVFYQHRHNMNDYWISIIRLFIDSKLLNKLPDNITNFGKKYLTILLLEFKPFLAQLIYFKG